MVESSSEITPSVSRVAKSPAAACGVVPHHLLYKTGNVFRSSLSHNSVGTLGTEMDRLPDKLWRAIEIALRKHRERGNGGEYCKPSLQPRKRRGRPVGNERALVEGVFYLMRVNIPWRALPRQYPPVSTCHRALHRWDRRGELSAIVRAVIQYCEKKLYPNEVVRESLHSMPAKEYWAALGFETEMTNDSKRYYFPSLRSCVLALGPRKKPKSKISSLLWSAIALSRWYGLKREKNKRLSYARRKWRW